MSLRLTIARRWAALVELVSDWLIVRSINALRRVRKIEERERRDERD